MSHSNDINKNYKDRLNRDQQNNNNNSIRFLNSKKLPFSKSKEDRWSQSTGGIILPFRNDESNSSPQSNKIDSATNVTRQLSHGILTSPWSRSKPTVHPIDEEDKDKSMTALQHERIATNNNFFQSLDRLKLKDEEKKLNEIKEEGV